MDSVQKILTLKEVADHLRCSKTHVQHAIQGRLPGVPRLAHVSMGRRKLVRSDWLQTWLEESKPQ
jgi:excisionase family DNA binding protein